MTIQSVPHRSAKQRKAPSRRSKGRRNTMEGSDVYCDGKRVTGGPTIFELLEMREKQRKLASLASPRPNRSGKHSGKKNGNLRHREK